MAEIWRERAKLIWRYSLNFTVPREHQAFGACFWACNGSFSAELDEAVSSKPGSLVLKATLQPKAKRNQYTWNNNYVVQVCHYVRHIRLGASACDALQAFTKFHNRVFCIYVIQAYGHQGRPLGFISANYIMNFITINFAKNSLTESKSEMRVFPLVIGPYNSCYVS